MGYTAAVHDSTAWEGCMMYKKQDQLLTEVQYLLADKTYALECHVITPPYA